MPVRSLETRAKRRLSSLNTYEEGEANVTVEDRPGLRRMQPRIRVLRRIFVGLYAVLILGLLFCWVLDDDLIGLTVITLIGLWGQVVFIASAGTRDLCRPIHKRRLVLPVIIAAFMLGLLATGLFLAGWELSEPFLSGGPINDDFMGIMFFSLVGGTWLFWGIVLFVFALHWERFQFLSRVAAFLFVGSLAQLMATLPSHLYIINKRSGCFVGLISGIGLTAGISVMIWSFGPAVILLFLYPRYKKQKALDPVYCPTCGLDLRGSVVAGRKTCPDCQAPIPVQHE